MTDTSAGNKSRDSGDGSNRPGEFPLARYQSAVHEVRAAARTFDELILHWRSEPLASYEISGLQLLTLVSNHLHAIVDLEAQSREHLPSALCIARAAFETALNCSWIFSGSENEPQMPLRWLGLHEEAAKTLERVSKKAGSIDMPDAAARWEEGAIRRRRFIETSASRLDLADVRLPGRPDVAEMCRRHGLARLYWGYHLTSQFVHGSLLAAEEYDAGISSRTGQSGWSDEWILALNMTVWSVALGAYAFAQFRGSSASSVDLSAIAKAATALDGLVSEIE